MLASLSSWSYRSWFEHKEGFDLMAFLDEAHRQGADGVEIYPTHLDPEEPGGHLKAVAARGRELGLEFASVIAANDFAQPVARQRAGQVERMKQWIVHTAGAGIERMNTFTGYHTAGDDPFMEACRVIDAYRELMPVAEEHDVLLCIENHSSVSRGADGLVEIIRRVGSAHLRTNPDFTNFVPDFRHRSERALEAIYSETERVAPYAANAHLKVGNDFTEDGEHPYVDVGRLVGIMRAAGYDGHIVLEYYGRDEPADSSERGLALLRRYI